MSSEKNKKDKKRRRSERKSRRSHHRKKHEKRLSQPVGSECSEKDEDHPITSSILRDNSGTHRRIRRSKISRSFSRSSQASMDLQQDEETSRKKVQAAITLLESMGVVPDTQEESSEEELTDEGEGESEAKRKQLTIRSALLLELKEGEEEDLINEEKEFMEMITGLEKRMEVIRNRRKIHFNEMDALEKKRLKLVMKKKKYLRKIEEIKTQLERNKEDEMQIKAKKERDRMAYEKLEKEKLKCEEERKELLRERERSELEAKHRKKIHRITKKLIRNVKRKIKHEEREEKKRREKERKKREKEEKKRRKEEKIRKEKERKKKEIEKIHKFIGSKIDEIILSIKSKEEKIIKMEKDKIAKEYKKILSSIKKRDKKDRIERENRNLIRSEIDKVVSSIKRKEEIIEKKKKDEENKIRFEIKKYCDGFEKSITKRNKKDLQQLKNSQPSEKMEISEFVDTIIKGIISKEECNDLLKHEREERMKNNNKNKNKKKKKKKSHRKRKANRRNKKSFSDAS